MLSRSLKVLTRNYTHTRKMKTYIPKHYEAIPHHYKPIFIDVHDSYKLRSKEQLQKELNGLQYSYEVDKSSYPNEVDSQIRGRKVVMRFDLTPFAFTKLQQLRLQVLMGPRYNPNSNIQKLTVEMLPTFDENFEKAKQMFYELIVEAKRAP